MSEPSKIQFCYLGKIACAGNDDDGIPFALISLEDGQEILVSTTHEQAREYAAHYGKRVAVTIQVLP